MKCACPWWSNPAEEGARPSSCKGHSFNTVLEEAQTYLKKNKKEEVK